MNDTIEILRTLGVQPTPQRIAVADYVLNTEGHPSADEVLARSRETCPTISRASVYNTLNLLVDKGLLKAHTLREGAVVFDRNTERHHHFIDEESGEIHDIPWEHLAVSGGSNLADFQIRDYQVILRGRKKES
ncbi:transcriptional repressor [candidate division GN15 bacterium]|nr:transcriptional repressor [candidate division GN15 bacterium]